MSHPYVLLVAAIACEVVATLSLRATSGFSRVAPSIVVVIGYAACFFLLGLAFKAGLSLNIGYAIWSGAGTAVIAVVSTVLFKERLTVLGMVGIAAVIAGVVLLHIGGEADGEGDVAPLADTGRGSSDDSSASAQPSSP